MKNRSVLALCEPFPNPRLSSRLRVCRAKRHQHNQDSHCAMKHLQEQTQPHRREEMPPPVVRSGGLGPSSGPQFQTFKLPPILSKEEQIISLLTPHICYSNYLNPWILPEVQQHPLLLEELQSRPQSPWRPEPCPSRWGFFNTR